MSISPADDPKHLSRTSIPAVVTTCDRLPIMLSPRGHRSLAVECLDPEVSASYSYRITQSVNSTISIACFDRRTTVEAFRRPCTDWLELTAGVFSRRVDVVLAQARKISNTMISPCLAHARTVVFYWVGIGVKSPWHIANWRKWSMQCALCVTVFCGSWG